MARTLDRHVIGLSSLNKKLKRVRGGLGGPKAAAAIQSAADAIVVPDAARRAQSGRTNELSESIHSEIRQVGPLEAVVAAGTNVFYASYVEFGVSGGDVAPEEAEALRIEDQIRESAATPGNPPKPFLRPAYDENEREFINHVRNELRFSLRRLLK